MTEIVGMSARPVAPPTVLGVGPRHLAWLLVVPLAVFLAVFLVVPVGLLFITSFNPSSLGPPSVTGELTLANYIRFFERSNFVAAAGRSLLLATVVSGITLLIGFPMAFVIARARRAAHATVLLILVLAAMQLDMVIRLYGMMVVLGDNGLVNRMLAGLGLISAPAPLMYNFLGVVLGLVQFALPFMILTLVGVVRGIHPSLEEAARSLGASWWRTFWRITLPASMPGILAGCLLVFALSISSYIVPALMGGFRVGVLPIHIYQQVAESARFQFGATVAVVLFVISTTAVLSYMRVGARRSGGLA